MDVFVLHVECDFLTDLRVSANLLEAKEWVTTSHP